MTTPDLPPPNAYFWTPKPGSGLRPELKSWSTNPGPRPEWDIVSYYTTEEVAAAVLAERENMLADIRAEIALEGFGCACTPNRSCGTCITRRTLLGVLDPLLKRYEAAIRAEPPKEQQP